VATEIIMPAVSTSMTEGVLARWVKKEGEKVAKGEIVAEIETDKAVLELEAEGDGLLGKIFFSDGATVAVGGVMGVIVAEGAQALKKVPAANASWTETAVRQFKTVDISVAVATPAGLITPIVRNADQKSIGAISTEVKDLADRARQGKLKPHEYQGGGFSISNLGMYGVQSFAAIINPPQACILAVGAGEKRAVVRGEEIVAATVMTTTLSVDHRVVDGAVGAEFLAQFKHLIENPLNLLV